MSGGTVAIWNLHLFIGIVLSFTRFHFIHSRLCKKAYTVSYPYTKNSSMIIGAWSYMDDHPAYHTRVGMQLGVMCRPCTSGIDEHHLWGDYDHLLIHHLPSAGMIIPVVWIPAFKQMAILSLDALDALRIDGRTKIIFNGLSTYTGSKTVTYIY